MLAAPFYLTLIITLGAIEPGFSHCTSLMSLLGGVTGVRGLAFNLGVVATGVCVIVFSIGLQRSLPSRWTAKVGSVLFLIGGLGLIGAGIFHCNQDCRNILADPNVVGRLHLISSLFAGMGTGLALFFFWAAMRGSGKWRGFVTPTLVVAVLANVPGIVLWFTIFANLRLHAVEGLIQRVGIIVVLIWIFFVAARLERASGWEKQ
jgi:hypothetical protein